MNTATRILIVEDLPEDYELALHEIRREVEQCKFERVERQADFLRALHEFQPDLILSDYGLPDFDGMKALKLAQKHSPTVPVIIWTGSMNEDIAVECMKMGASNYIIKGNLKRLGPAVTRALEERNLLVESKKTEERYRVIFENAMEGIFQSTLEGRYISVNPTMARIYGYSSPAEMIESITDISSQIYAEPGNRSQFIKLLQDQDTVRDFEMKNRCKDGRVIWTSTSARAVRDEDGTILYYEGFLQDITERKEIENAEREQRALADALRHTAEALSSTLEYGEVLDQILITVGTVVPCDAATIMFLEQGKAHIVRSQGYRERGLDAKIMGVELSLVETANLWQMLLTRKPVIVPDVTSSPGWISVPGVNWVRSNVGAPICLHGEVIGFILLDSETPNFFAPLHAEHLESFANQAALAIHNSRLMQRAQEELTARKRTEEALRESEERFRLIAQNAEDMIWTMDMNLQLTYVSPAVERALGYTSQEILASPPKQFVLPQSYTMGLKAFMEEIENFQLLPDANYSRLLEMEYRRKDGSTFWVEMRFSFFRDANGYPVGILGVGRDVTTRREVEARVKDLFEFNEKILNQSPLGILTYKVNGDCNFANENAASIVGTTVEELKRQNFHAIPSWRESGLYDLVTRSISTRSAVSDDVHHRSTFGKDVWLRAHFVPFKSKGEEHLLLTIYDITDRRRADDKRRESENRLVLALSAAQMSVWEWNSETNEVLLSPDFYALTGIPESAFDGTFESFVHCVHSLDIDRVRASAKKAIVDNTIFADEFRIIGPDHEVRWLAVHALIEYSLSGVPRRMIGTIRDITHRKQVEMERQTLLEIMQGLARTADLQEFLAILHRSIGNVIYAENFFVVVHNKDTGLFEEIYSVDQYDPPSPPSALEKSITSYVFRSGESLLLDQEFFDELAVRGEVELVGTNSASWLGVPLKTLNETIGVIVVQDYDNPRRYSERDKNFLSSIATQVALALERKQAEEKVLTSEERYRALFESSPISIWEEDFSRVKKYLDALRQQGITDFRSYFASHPDALIECNKLIGVLDVNHAGLQMYQAKSKKELIDSTLQTLCQGENDHNLEDFIAIAEGRTSHGWEGADETMSGEPLEINLRWSVAPGYEQDFSKVIVTVIDITERKRAEQQLQASEERFRQMANNIEEVFWLTDAQTGKELYLSPACEKIWGCSSEYMMQEPDMFINSVLPQDQPVVLYNLERQKYGEKTEMEYRILRPDGSVRWIWDRAFPVFDEHGRVKVLAGIAADITARKQAEESLRESEERFSTAFEFAPIGKGLASLDGRWIQVNRALCSLLGYTEQELMAKTFQEITHPDDLEIDLVYMEEMLSGEVISRQLEKRYFHKSGNIIWVLLSISLIKDGSGQPSYFIAQIQDITERKNSEREIARHLGELEALYENGLAVGQLLEPRQIGERIIETFARHLSWHHVTIRLINPGTDELTLIAFNQPGLRNEERAEIEQRFTTLISRVGQGMCGWVAQTGEPIRAGNVLEYPQYVVTHPGIKSGLYMPLRVGERVIGVISVESEEPDALTAQDERLLATLANQAAIALENARLYQAAQQEIAERKLIEEELRKSQERYQLLIETSPDGIVMINMDGKIRFSNIQMAELFDYDTSAELLGISFASLFAPEEQAYIDQQVSYPELDHPSEEGHWLIRKDGTRFFGELRSSALLNEQGEQYAIMAQLRDVTERKQSQEALHEERQRFLDLFENSPNPTWLEDFTGVIAWMESLKTQGITNLRKYLEDHPDEFRTGVSLIRTLNVNHAAVIANGARNKQELISRVHELLLDDLTSSHIMHELVMIWEGNTSFGFEMTNHRMDGSLTTGIQRIYIPTNHNGPDYARVIVTSTDITDRVEIERKLRTSELHYRELADSITDVLFELDHDLHCTHWNRASEVLMGIPAHEAIGKSMYELFGETDEQLRIGKIYRSVLEKDQAKTFETEIVIQDQKYVFEINANPSTRGVSVVARNITGRKLDETLMKKRFELMEYSARHSLEEVLQRTVDIVSELTGSHLGFLHFIENDQMTIKMQAWSTETLGAFCKAEGKEMHYPVEQAGVWADAARQKQPIIHNDYAALPNRKGTPDGHANIVREMVIPVIRGEKVVALMGVGNKDQEYTFQDMEMAERFADYAWDITERKLMENTLAEERNQLAKRVEERTSALSRANSNLARALRVKDEFLANMSHELRTPLNAILGLSESLGEQVAGPLNEKQQKYLSTINESGHHLLALINDILDLAKIEAGQITLDIATVDVNSVCQASLRMIRQLAQKKQLEVLFEIDDNLGLIQADERRLKQMIVNLLSNAVKFTPELSRIGLEVRGDRAANMVIITVWDTGIGIQEQDLKRLFKPFVQLDSGLAREATGTGLGLALVAEMARLHGGSVHASSRPGEGSRFIIKLPWEPAFAGELNDRLKNTGKFRAIDPSIQRPTVLLIEDTREVVMMLVDYLEMAGYKMVTAQDGLDGLAQAKLIHPDLILMDIQMPRMDGFEATQRLKSDPELRDVPIIALTALAMPDDRQRCLDAGMDEYISKPVNLRTLAKAMQKLLLRRADPS